MGRHGEVIWQGSGGSCMGRGEESDKVHMKSLKMLSTPAPGVSLKNQLTTWRSSTSRCFADAPLVANAATAATKMATQVVELGVISDGERTLLRRLLCIRACVS